MRDKGRRVRLMLAMSYKQEGIYNAAAVRANTYFSSSRASMGEISERVEKREKSVLARGNRGSAPAETPDGQASVNRGAEHRGLRLSPKQDC